VLLSSLMISRRDRDPAAQVLEMLLDSQESAGGHGIIMYLPKVSVLAVTDSPIVVCTSAPDQLRLASCIPDSM
jgi:hypothetical protein